MRPLVRTSSVSAPPTSRSRRAARVATRASVLAEDLKHPFLLVPQPDRRATDRRAADRRTPSTAREPRPTIGLDFAAAAESGTLERAELSLSRRIRAHLARGHLAVTLTDNRHTMISVRRDRPDSRDSRDPRDQRDAAKSSPRYRVRLHHMFADADPQVTRALARYIGDNDPAASRVLGAYIDSQQHRVRPVGRVHPAPPLEVRGRHFDLAEIYRDLNQRYFEGTIDARITWGQRPGKARRRNSIKMGSYSVEERLIRVHRSLDRAFVPRYFVEWIVFHEMLHQVHQAEVVNGRRMFHTAAFLADEASFEHYDRARAWERAHLDEILTY